MNQRYLVLLRHAKADLPAGVADVDRPLTERGHADAGTAGAWLAVKDYRPDLVLCSPARRTRQTWHGVAVALADGSAPFVRYEPLVYRAGSTAELLDLLRQAGPQPRRVLLVGHNPTISLLSAALDPAGVRDSDGLCTSGLAVHEVPGDWDALAPGTAPLIDAYTARG